MLVLRAADLRNPEVAVADEAPGAFRAAVPGILMFAADGWIAAGFYFVWQIPLFLALGESFTAYGGAMALTMREILPVLFSQLEDTEPD
jgi:hypothetical protein